MKYKYVSGEGFSQINDDEDKENIKSDELFTIVEPKISVIEKKLNKIIDLMKNFVKMDFPLSASEGQENQNGNK